MDLHVNVIPSSEKDEIVRFDRGGLDVRLISANPDGSANDRLVNLLSIELDYPASHIKVISGFEGADKKVSIRGMSEGDLISRLRLGAYRSSLDVWEKDGEGKDKSRKRSIRSKKESRKRRD